MHGAKKTPPQFVKIPRPASVMVVPRPAATPLSVIVGSCNLCVPANLSFNVPSCVFTACVCRRENASSRPRWLIIRLHARSVEPAAAPCLLAADERRDYPHRDTRNGRYTGS